MNQEQAGSLPSMEQPANGPPAQQPPVVTPPQQPASVTSLQQPESIIPDQQPANEASAPQPENPSPDNILPQQPTTVPGEEKRKSPEEQENEQQNGVGKEEEDEQHTPKINCPEKIVLCVDLSSELNEIILRQNQKDRTVFEQLKKAMEIFVKHKLRFNKKHKIAILTFEKEALWVQDFSSDVHLINDTLDNIRPNPEFPLPQFDMASLLETIENHVELPRVPNVLDIPPEYVVRVILIYGRSHSEIPTLSREARRIFDRFTSCRLFFFDVLYIHQLPDEDNKCEEIYDAFCKLDETEECFVLEVSTYVAARLYEYTAKLLAHPLQRPRQQDLEYKIVKNDVDSSDEEIEPESRN